jgi:hypothetical protein
LKEINGQSKPATVIVTATPEQCHQQTDNNNSNNNNSIDIPTPSFILTMMLLSGTK